MSDCAHSWQPVSGWNARYRCEWCHALAYKHIITGGMRGNPVRMAVYICKRPGCTEPAITHKESQLCREHAEARAAKGKP